MAALLREGAAALGHEQGVGQHEDDRQDDEPREALRPVGGDRSERVEPDERADGEEDHVEAPQRLDELGLLDDGQRGGLLDDRRGAHARTIRPRHAPLCRNPTR
ncbi:MAG: hypothetical protein ACXVFN_09555 [Solirubrobacteraceae bacterium]